MIRIETSLPEVFILEPKVFADERGFFMETYHTDKFRELGIEDNFVQDNHSRSVKGTLRGLHYQINRPQSKLCRVASGQVLDVAVDIRKGSPNFGKWVSVILSEENKRMIYVPRGFAHGFYVMSETADFLYKCGDVYIGEFDRGIFWNDPAIGIDWQLDGEPLLSAKDRNNPLLAAAGDENLPEFGKA